jgi:hypothetical protein
VAETHRVNESVIDCFADMKGPFVYCVRPKPAKRLSANSHQKKSKLDERLSLLARPNAALEKCRKDHFKKIVGTVVSVPEAKPLFPALVVV